MQLGLGLVVLCFVQVGLSSRYILESFLRKAGLCMHVGRGDAASKTEAMYFPPPRTAYEAADTSRFYIDGAGYIDFCEKFKYLVSILYYSLTCDADAGRRIASATAAFGALKNIFTGKYSSEER